MIDKLIIDILLIDKLINPLFKYQNGKGKRSRQSQKSS